MSFVPPHSEKYVQYDTDPRPTLRKLLDESTPGPWEALYGTEKNPRSEPGAVVLQRSCHATYWRDYCFVSSAGTGQSFDDARLIALAPELAAAVLKTKDVLLPLVSKIEVSWADGSVEQMRADLEYLHRVLGDTVAFLREVGEPDESNKERR